MISTTPGGARGRYKLDELSQAWTASGAKLHRTVAGACVVSLCRSMAFVGLRTGEGTQAVCLRHYELLESAGTSSS